MELSQIIFDLENRDRSNLILLRKDRSRKSKLFLIGKLISYRFIKLTFYLKAKSMLNNATIT